MLKRRERLEEVLYTSGLGIGEEDLPEAVAADKGDKLLHTLQIELIEDVVEKEDGLLLRVEADIVELSQLQCQRETFLLSLRTILAHRHVGGKEQKEVVAMGANCGMGSHTVGVSAGRELPIEGGWIVLVREGDIMVGGGDRGIVVAEEGKKIIDKACSAGVELFAMLDELLIPEVDLLLIPCAIVVHLLQEPVALGEGFGVLKQMVEVGMVDL